MVWNEKQMGLSPGCTRLDFRDERMGTGRGHDRQSVMVSYLLSPSLAGARDTVPGSRVLQQDVIWGLCCEAPVMAMLAAL